MESYDFLTIVLNAFLSVFYYCSLGILVRVLAGDLSDYLSSAEHHF